MTIKAHCMGMEFPRRDAFDRFLEGWAKKLEMPEEEFVRKYVAPCFLPTAADLDAVAEEQKAKEQTSGKTYRRQP